MSRITCRACGRHSDQPDRFYDLSVPLLAVASPAPTAGSNSTTNARDDDGHVGDSAGRGGSGSGRGDDSMMSPTLESPRAEWEPSPSDTRSGSAAVEGVDGDGESTAGDHASEWGGGWRRAGGGLCSLRRSGGDGTGHGDSAARGNGAGGSSGGYVGGLVSSVGVWLGIKSVALEVRSVKIRACFFPGTGFVVVL